MKEMIKKVKERREGFTMAEMLIVVAIIAVLVAIAIPVFTSQLHKSEVATDQANARSYYAELQAAALTEADYAAGTQDADWDKPLTASSTIKMQNGESITLKTGTVTSTYDPTNGWKVTYADTGSSCSNCGGMTFGN